MSGEDCNKVLAHIVNLDLLLPTRDSLGRSGETLL